MAAPRGPHNRPTFAKAAWVAEAVRLACDGMSERQIAARFGLHHSTVNEALRAEFERVRPSESEVQAMREMKRERLYRGLEKWTRARDDSIAAHEANPDNLPDYRAGELILKTEALLASLEGTDAPRLTEVTGKDGAPLVAFDMSKLSDEQIAQLSVGDASALSAALFEGGAGGDPEAGESGAGEAPGDREPA